MRLLDFIGVNNKEWLAEKRGKELESMLNKMF